MISRRSFIKILGLTTAYFSSGLGSIVHAAYDKSAIYMTDFGGLIFKSINGLVYDNEEAKDILRNNGALHPRGTGHSVMGRSLKEGTTIFTPEIIDLSFGDELVYASAGSTLLDIDNYLEPFGYMLPTSPDHRAVSLGGVLSVGGYGIEVCKYGPLVEHVHSLDVMDKEGNIITGLPGNDPRAQQILCGIGQHEIILAAKIKCIRKPLFNHLKIETINSVDHYIDTCAAYINDPNKDEKFDIFCAHWSDGNNLMTQGKTIYEENKENPLPHGYQITNDYRAYKKNVSDNWTFKKDYKYYIWSDHFFKLKDLKIGLEKGLEIKESAFKDGAAAIIYSSITRTNKINKHFPHYCPDEDYVVSVGIFANFLAKDKESAIKCAKSQMQFSKDMQERFNAGVYRYGWMWDENFNFENI